MPIAGIVGSNHEWERQMSVASRVRTVRVIAFGLAVVGSVTAIAGSAIAADIDPGYPPYSSVGPDYYRQVMPERRYVPAPPIDRSYEAVGERCRIHHERRIDPYGREIVHRV